MKIGIYGGSFNPIHKGHLEVVKYAIEELKFDKVILVPAFKSPFKSTIKYAPAEDRIKMIELVLFEKCEVSLFEINRKGISYTIDTLQYFKQKYPDDELHLIIGSDQVYKLNKWKNINEIANLAKIVVFRREGEFSKVNIKRYDCLLLNNDFFSFSSTNFRGGLLGQVDERVVKYISSKYLYIQDFMLAMLDHKRHKHSQSVGSYAAKFAKAAGVDPKKAWATGCLHDITKCWPIEQHYEFLSKFGYNGTQFQNFELHALTGALWVKHCYLLDDEEVYQAILKHTSLAPELSQLDKVIFAADKLCDNRRHEGIQKDRQLIIQDFDAGFKRIVEVVYNTLVEKDRPLSDVQAEIYQRWM